VEKKHDFDFWSYAFGAANGTREILKVIRQDELPVCKHCGSRQYVVRYGKYSSVQRWWCKKCKRKFIDNTALSGMKTPIEQVASALNMYYEGMSLNAIRRHLEQMHRNYPSDSTVYEWISRFTKQAVKQVKEYTPEVGDVWVADETVLKIGGQNVWFWDLIDSKTRYLLASHLSTKRTTRDARVLTARAAQKAGKPPKVIITDKLAAYIDGIELNFGADTIHIPAKDLRATPGTQLIERFHSTLKARTKVMRGLKNIQSAKLLTDGWLVHYNYLRPHEALGNKTPAQKAGLKYPFKNWMDIVKTKETATIISKPSKLISTETPEITPVKRLGISPKPPRISRDIGRLI